MCQALAKALQEAIHERLQGHSPSTVFALRETTPLSGGAASSHEVPSAPNSAQPMTLNQPNANSAQPVAPDHLDAGGAAPFPQVPSSPNSAQPAQPADQRVNPHRNSGMLQQLLTNRPAEALRFLARLHRNLGHASREQLVRQLQAKGASPAIIAAAKSYQCPCAQLAPLDQAPKSLRLDFKTSKDSSRHWTTLCRSSIEQLPFRDFWDSFPAFSWETASTLAN